MIRFTFSQIMTEKKEMFFNFDKPKRVRNYEIVFCSDWRCLDVEMSDRTLITATGEKPILYSRNLSSCVWRVRIVLNLKNISFDVKTVCYSDLKDEEKSKEYLKLNPMLQVPALIIEGHTLIESVAIMHFLEEAYPQCPILPKDLFKRAKVREIVEVIVAGIQPKQNMNVLVKVGDKQKQLEWAQYYIASGFRAIEQLLSMSAEKYCVGDEITMADCCLVPQVFNARKFHLDLSPYPTIVRIDRELESHPAFVAAHPRHQPDFCI